MKTYNLFLDDVRQPADCLTYINNRAYVELKWDVVKTHASFVKHIEDKWKEGEFPSTVSFDHDLAPEHYHPSMYAGVKAYNSAYQKMEEPTGRSSAEWLVKFCIENELEMPRCYIHSMNPAGRERIRQTLGDYERFMARTQK